MNSDVIKNMLEDLFNKKYKYGFKDPHVKKKAYLFNNYLLSFLGASNTTVRNNKHSSNSRHHGAYSLVKRNFNQIFLNICYLVGARH